jgi:hypothetical protein
MYEPCSQCAGLPLTPAEFRAAPAADLQPYVPAALVYAAAGTRRSAALAGLRAADDEYASWSRSQMINVLRMMYDHHVQHIFTIPATPGQFAEVGPYRGNLVRWIDWGVAGDDALAEYAALGWRVRLVSFGAPELAAAERRLASLPAANSLTAKTLWYIVVADSGALWQRLLATAAESKAQTRADAARALYGEAPPDIGLFIGFGKPVVAPELLPPLLHDKVDCYWTQRPGYRMTEGEFRTILYDHAIARATWQADKRDRAQAALAHREEWEQGPILGLGTRLGPYWYPQPFAHVGTASQSTS